MTRLVVTAAALALLTTAAQATSKPYTFYKGGYWETFGMVSNSDGDPMCGMQTSGANNQFYVKWTPTNGMVVQVWKSNWRLSNETNVSFSLEFSDNEKPDDHRTLNTDTGWATRTKDGSGSSLFMAVANDSMAELLKVFSDADTAVITFPEGDEPSWSVKMDGSRKATNEFMHCMYAIQQTIKSAHPTSPVAPTQPVVPSQPAPAQSKSTTSEMLFVIPPDVSGGHMNVRNGPGANHGLLGAIPAGQTVAASRCVRRDDGIAGADWCLVTWNGLTGWVSQVGLMPVTPQPTQPVARPATSKDNGGV